MDDEQFQRIALQAGHYLRNQDWKRAIAGYRQLLAMDPDFAPGHAALAFCLWQDEQYTDADMAADAALQLDPEEPNHFYIKGCIQASLERYVEARGYLQQAVAGNPEDGDSFVALGHVLLNLKLIPQARAAAEKAVKLDPGDAPSRLLLAAVEEASGNNRRARELREQARSIAPEWSEAHHQVAISDIVRGAGRQSVEEMKEALRLDPTNETLQHNYVIAQTAGCLFFKPMLLVLAALNTVPRAVRILGVWAFLFIAAWLLAPLASRADDSEFRLIVMIGFCVVLYFVIAYVLFFALAERARLPHGEVTWKNVNDFFNSSSTSKKIATGCGGGCLVYIVGSMVLGALATGIRALTQR